MFACVTRVNHVDGTRTPCSELFPVNKRALNMKAIIFTGDVGACPCGRHCLCADLSHLKLLASTRTSRQQGMLLKPFLP